MFFNCLRHTTWKTGSRQGGGEGGSVTRAPDPGQKKAAQQARRRRGALPADGEGIRGDGGCRRGAGAVSTRT